MAFLCTWRGLIISISGCKAVEQYPLLREGSYMCKQVVHVLKEDGMLVVIRDSSWCQLGFLYQFATGGILWYLTVLKLLPKRIMWRQFNSLINTILLNLWSVQVELAMNKFQLAAIYLVRQTCRYCGSWFKDRTMQFIGNRTNFDVSCFTLSSGDHKYLTLCQTNEAS